METQDTHDGEWGGLILKEPEAAVEKGADGGVGGAWTLWG